MKLGVLQMAVLLSVGVLCGAQPMPTKSSAAQQTYPQPPAVIQKALKNLPGGTSGSLPVLDGFVLPGAHPLDRFQRPYYQCNVRVTPVASGSLVRVTAKITAWSSTPGHSGYETLESNGRLESDLLERLQEALNSLPSPNRPVAQSGAVAAKAEPPPDISAPMPQLPRHPQVTLPAAGDGAASVNPKLEQEAKDLEEIVRNQTHPSNLVAVKQDQTPVQESPSASAKVLFLASAEDEFEVLDVNPAWVHVRISGLSRGWLRRASVEMLDGSSPVSTAAASRPERSEEATAPQSSQLFSVSSDEVGTFPGEWAPLKGKSVKMIAVQQAPGSGRITSPQDKMHFAESVFKRERLSSPAQGLVLIFDAEDGGMIAATSSALDQWKNGSIAEQAFWKQCFLDPPEILGGAN